MKISAKNRTIWIIAIVAVVFMGGGIALGRFIISPAQAAADAEAPDAGPITVPVELKTLANSVTLRADATYDDPVDVKLDTSGLSTGAIVTGQVPERGATIDAGQVVLQVAGRPVIALTGPLPVYRTLRFGEAGPDVLQLKQALAALGIDVGNVESDQFDAQTAEAVKALYGKVGYTPPASGTDAEAAVESAQKAVSSAQEQVTSANKALNDAKAPPSESVQITNQNAVDAAQRRLDSISSVCSSITNPDTGEVTTPVNGPDCGPIARANANDELRLAIAQRDEALKPKDTSVEQASVKSANEALADAREALTKAQQGALTALPASEVIFLPSLPRRVDQVNITYGATISGPVMTVSGATLQLVASAAKADAEFLKVGDTAVFALPDSKTEVTATIQEIKSPSQTASQDQGTGSDGQSGQGSGDQSANRYQVIFSLPELTDEQITELQGRNIKITIPIESTGGEVLAVPSAAVQSGPGGEPRVEKLTGDPRGEYTTELITVEVGLTANGFVQITPQGDLKKGDLIVAGAK